MVVFSTTRLYMEETCLYCRWGEYDERGIHQDETGAGVVSLWRVANRTELDLLLFLPPSLPSFSLLSPFLLPPQGIPGIIQEDSSHAWGVSATPCCPPHPPQRSQLCSFSWVWRRCKQHFISCTMCKTSSPWVINPRHKTTLQNASYCCRFTSASVLLGVSSCKAWSKGCILHFHLRPSSSSSSLPLFPPLSLSLCSWVCAARTPKKSWAAYSKDSLKALMSPCSRDTKMWTSGLRMKSVEH